MRGEQQEGGQGGHVEGEEGEQAEPGQLGELEEDQAFWRVGIELARAGLCCPFEVFFPQTVLVCKATINILLKALNSGKGVARVLDGRSGNKLEALRRFMGYPSLVRSPSKRQLEHKFKTLCPWHVKWVDSRGQSPRKDIFSGYTFFVSNCCNDDAAGTKPVIALIKVPAALRHVSILPVELAPIHI